MTVRHAYFRRKLAVPITPKVGLGTPLRTLEDCGRFLGSLHGWRQARPHWEFAAELILKGARTGRRVDVDAAAQQVERALGCDGWLRPVDVLAWRRLD